MRNASSASHSEDDKTPGMEKMVGLLAGYRGMSSRPCFVNSLGSLALLLPLLLLAAGLPAAAGPPVLTLAFLELICGYACRARRC